MKQFTATNFEAIVSPPIIAYYVLSAHSSCCLKSFLFRCFHGARVNLVTLLVGMLLSYYY